jgi:hypothetical protein
VSLEDSIDELYRLPLGEFTAARNALAKTLKGDDSRRVRALAKPTVVPWAVNQLFWQSRPVYDRLMKSGRALRAAQVAALNDPSARTTADVKRTAEAHRAALAEAVGQAARLAAREGAHPDADDLSRTLDALSLSADPSDRPGRLTEVVRPAGFEALAGLSVAAINPAEAGSHGDSGANLAKARSHGDSRTHGGTRTVGSGFSRISLNRRRGGPQSDPEVDDARRRAEELAARAREEELAARRLQAETELRAAEQELERARAAEHAARESLDTAERAREQAHERLKAARKRLSTV